MPYYMENVITNLSTVYQFHNSYIKQLLLKHINAIEVVVVVLQIKITIRIHFSIQNIL